MPSPEASNSRSLGLFNKATRPRISAAVISRVATCAQVIFGMEAVCCHDSAASTTRGCAKRSHSQKLISFAAWQAWHGVQNPTGGHTRRAGVLSTPKVVVTLLLAFGFALHVLSFFDEKRSHAVFAGMRPANPS